MKTHQEPLGKVISIFQSIVLPSLKILQAYVIWKLELIEKITLYIISQG